MTEPQNKQPLSGTSNSLGAPVDSVSIADVDLNALKQSRAALRRSLIAMKNKIEKGDAVDATILECRLTVLESHFKQL